MGSAGDSDCKLQVRQLTRQPVHTTGANRTHVAYQAENPPAHSTCQAPEEALSQTLRSAAGPGNSPGRESSSALSTSASRVPPRKSNA